MEIKVCGMREKGNSRLLEKEVLPDWMGMIFYSKSPRFVPDTAAEELREVTLPKVGVFVNENAEEIVRKIQDFQLSAVQLHGNESVQFVKELKSKVGVEIWKVVSVKDRVDWEQLKGYLPYVNRFLFDTATPTYGGAGKKFNWNFMLNYPFDKEFLLSGGLDEHSVAEIMELSEKLPQLVGVDLNSKFEDAPGLKNIEKLKQFKRRITEA